MDTVALVEPNTRLGHRVTPRTASFIAILHSEGGTVVACSHDTAVFDDDAADGPLHTVGSLAY